MDGFTRGDVDLTEAFCAEHVSTTSAPLFGIRPTWPKKGYEAINKETLSEFNFTDGGAVLRYCGHAKPPHWTQVSIKWWHQWRVMKHIRADMTEWS